MRLFLSLVVILLFLYSILPPIWPKTDDHVSALVFFCPETDCMALFEAAVHQAKKSIHCALYDLSDQLLPSFDGRSIDISIIYDVKNKVLPRQYLHPRKISALSHNKFCVFDGQYVWTGSFNPTGNRNRNDVLLISSRYLAANYEAEFQELRGGKPRQTPYPHIVSDVMSMQNAFCPEDQCEQKVLDALSEAQKSIDVMAYSFTDPTIAMLLLAKKEQGVNVRVLLEARQVGERSVYTMLRQHVPVQASNQEGLLHYKVFVIDNETVITGSANPTKNGYGNNDENILILHNPQIALQYSHRFVEESQENHVSLLRQKTGE